MATVTKSKGKGSKKTKKPTSEEIMDPIDPVDPVAAIVAEKDDIIAQLNEKIRSMTIEIETLRKSVPKKRASSSVIQVGSPTIKTPAKPRKNTLLSSSSISTPTRLKNTELNLSDRSIKTKGCSCKGHCKTKICGCVKKNQPCTENCKCTEACENISDEVFDDNDKENVDKNQVNNNVKIEHQDDDSDDDDDDDDDYTENFEANVVTKKSLDNASTTSGSHGSNSSESHQSNEEEEEEEHQKDNFNPMKPTKTLPRSPLVGKSESMMNQSSPGTDVDENKLVPQVDTSKTDTAIIVKPKGNKSDDEGLITTVDWEKHQNELKPCSKCHRRFFPDRLPIHENACLKI